MVGTDNEAIFWPDDAMAAMPGLENGHIAGPVDERQRAITEVGHLAQVIQSGRHATVMLQDFHHNRIARHARANVARGYVGISHRQPGLVHA